MRYAEVSVSSPIAQQQTFSYFIPPELNVNIGQAVWVPFGNKLLQGIVLKLGQYPSVEKTREIIDVIESRPLLSRIQILLAQWISEYYLSPLFNAVALMLPPGFERKVITFISEVKITTQCDLSSLSQEQKQVLELIGQRGVINLSQLEKVLGKKKTQAAITRLVGKGLVNRSYELEPIRVKPKYELYISLAVKTDKAQQETEKLLKKRANKQATLLNYLVQQPSPVSWMEARKSINSSKATADALVNKGFAKIQQIEVKREPISYEKIFFSEPLKLTDSQRSAFQAIQSSLQERKTGQASSKIFLLHGVTGSGKTEVYLQALAEAIKQGKQGIVLVPEIALTPQTIERFASRFPHKVAVLHSKLTLGEQFDEWQRIRDGEFDVVIGPRSAIFAPLSDLGIIIIDEEHEWNYKQSDTSPRYHTRDVAIKLAELTGAVVVLGSATPDVETYYHAQRGDYHLLQLSERVTPSEGAPLPKVEIIDLKDELKAGNMSFFSRSLLQEISKTVVRREQAILFLNRRGAASFIQCRNCGFVLRCRRCEVTLNYHYAENILVCHQCNYKMPIPRVCPQCQSPRIKFLGIGTQKLEQEAGNTFPQARLLRWDSDSTGGKNSNQEILDKFRDHEADIIIGTQMVAKGLDLPLVTLVGVVSADTSINLPDFRAGERTFQLLSQVVGRAGRGTSGGQAIIQTYSPEHYAIQAAAKHDYACFYEKEITYRRQLQNPPFSRLVCLTYNHTNDILCQRESERMRCLIIEERDSQGIANLNIIGPAPAFIHRRRGRFRWQLILRGEEPSALLSKMLFPRGWTIDIDPVNLL
ncbi:MAG: primosomal protein N' [Dehalococcoidales bacterium]|nr:primosomal protein N' [Dehalococcoidales bacterium]